MVTKNLSPKTLAEKIAQLPKQDLLEVDRFIEFLVFRSATPKRKKNKKGSTPWLWHVAKRLEGVDSAEYSFMLRQKAARRADARVSD